MAGLASINVKFQVDLKQFSSEMQNSLREIDKFGQKMQSVGRGLTTFVTAPLLLAGGASVKFASDFEESTNKVDVAFGKSNQIVKDFAKTSLESFGLAEGSALDMASTFGDMGTSLGLTQGKAAQMSTSLVALAADLSSFKNISIDIANTALTGIFTGETESLKKLGIVMTETNLQNFAFSKGIKTKIADMDQASKVNLRYAYIMSVTENAQGDFTRTQGGAANQTRIFTESMKQLGQQFGQVILPYFTKIITSINGLVKSFSGLSDGAKTTIVVVAGLAAATGPLLIGIGAIAAGIPPLVVGFTALRTAFTAMSAAMIANPITAVAIVLGTAAASALLFSNNTQKATQAVVQMTAAQNSVNKVTEDATASIVAQKAELQSFIDVAKDETKTKKERLEAIAAINKLSPEYLGNLSLENIGTDKARVAIEKYNAALLQGAKARAAQETLQELYKKQIQTQLEREKSEESLNKLKDDSNKKQFLSAKEQERYNNLLNDKSGVLSSLRKKEDDNTAAQIAAVSKIYSDGKQYLDLLKDTGDQIEINSLKADKTKTAKRPDVEAVLSLSPQLGSADEYDAQIAKLKEFAKAMNIEPSGLIKTAETTEEMGQRISASIKSATDSMQADFARMKEIGDLVGNSLASAFEGMSSRLVESLGLANDGFGGFIAGLVQTVTKLIAMMLSAAISQSIAGATASGTATGPAAIFTTPAFIATAVGGVLAAFAAIPKFETGGIFGGSSYFGDKILARVNSGEMVANNTQQKNIWNAMNSGGGTVGYIADAKLKGNDIWLSFKRTEELKNRIG